MPNASSRTLDKLFFNNLKQSLLSIRSRTLDEVYFFKKSKIIFGSRVRSRALDKVYELNPPTDPFSFRTLLVDASLTHAVAATLILTPCRRARVHRSHTTVQPPCRHSTQSAPRPLSSGAPAPPSADLTLRAATPCFTALRRLLRSPRTAAVPSLTTIGSALTQPHVDMNIFSIAL